MACYDYPWNCLTIFFAGICFFQLAAGQNFNFLSVEYKDECAAALITFEVEVGDTFQATFAFDYYAVRGTMVS